MALGRSGQFVFLGIMVMIMTLFVIIAFVPVVKEVVAVAIDADHLDCDNAAISTGNKMTCILADLYLPYLVGVAIAAGGAYIGAKSLTGW